MSADRKAPKSLGGNGKTLMNDILDFGPDTIENVPQQTSPAFTDRIKKIVEKLQEINKRIDELTSRD